MYMRWVEYTTAPYTGLNVHTSLFLWRFCSTSFWKVLYSSYQSYFTQFALIIPVPY